jgi:hypothetical protein
MARAPIVTTIKADEYIANLVQFESDASNWLSLYQDCADYGMPNDNQITIKRSPGEEKLDTFQTEGENDIIKLASGLYSYMFPTDAKAFTIKIDNEELNDEDKVKQALTKAVDVAHEHLIQSTFRQMFFGFLKSLGCFGTGVMYEEPGKTQTINFVNFHIKNVFYEVDDDGVIDTIYRKFEYTARQAVKKFGKENLGTLVTTAYASNTKQQRRKKFKFIHIVEPRENVDGKNTDPLTMDYSSVYVCREDKMIVKESGYEEMPYQIAPFDQDAEEIRGRSPMMKMLPDVRQLSVMVQTRSKGWEKICDPPGVFPSDGSVWPMATQPGGVMYKMPGADEPTWFEFKGDIAALDDAIQKIKEEIKSGFFLDLFDVLIDRKNMTATEVRARIEQQLRFLTPIIGRLQSELFNPMIKRVINILIRAEKIILPEIISNVEYTIEYLGPLALAMKTLETQGFVIAMEQLKGFAEAERFEYMDNYNVDVITRDLSRNNGVPATWLNAEKEVVAIREARAVAEQRQALLENMPGMAKAAGDLGKAPEDGSIQSEIRNAA